MLYFCNIMYMFSNIGGSRKINKYRPGHTVGLQYHIPQQGRIQDLAMGGAKILSVAHKSIPGFFRILYCTPPPLCFFSEATIKVYTWIFFSEATIKSLYLDFLGFRIAPPLAFFFSEATRKVYTWIFF